MIVIRIGILIRIIGEKRIGNGWVNGGGLEDEEENIIGIKRS